MVNTIGGSRGFHADFGGKRGQRKILSSYLKTDLSGFRIQYRDYDWSDALMNFQAD